MNVLVFLIPVSIFLGLLGLVFFLWTMKSRQYDDPAGDAQRILSGIYDDAPPEAPTSGAQEEETVDAAVVEETSRSGEAGCPRPAAAKALS